MELLWLPISLFGKHVLSGLPDYFQTIPMFLFTMYFFYLMSKKKNRNAFFVPSGTLLFLLLLLITQGVATIRTILTFPVTGIGVFEKYFQFLSLLVYFLVVYLILKNTLMEEKKIQRFLNGFFVYTLLLTTLLGIQFLFIHTGMLKPVVQFIGKTFAQGEYSESINPNYLLSTIDYLTTFRRPNGLDPEGRDVAIRLSLIAAPFLLSALKNNYRLIKNKNCNGIYLLFLLIIFSMTLGIQTLSSILLGSLIAIFTLLIVILKKMNPTHLYYKEGAIFASVFGVGFAVSSLLPNAMTQLGDSNRTASTTALWRVFLHHPFFGAGYDFSSPYAILYAPEKHTNTLVNVQIYLANQQMPALSTLFAWLSQFGLVILFPLLFYILRTKLDFTILIERMQDTTFTPERCILYQTVDDLFFFFLIFLFPACLLLFDWRGLSYVLVVFFVFIVKDVLKRQLDCIAPLKERSKGEKVS